MPIKQPPHSERSERALLGALIVNPGLIESVRGIIEPADFYRPSLGTIFGMILGLSGSHVPVDTTTIAEVLEAHGQLEAVGGIPELAKLVDSVPRSAHAAHYATVVADFARRRKLIGLADSLASANGEFDRASEDFRRLLERAPARTLTHDALADINDPNAGRVSWLVSGLIPRDDVTLIAATWKTAKTLLSYAMVCDLLQGRPVWGHFRVEAPLRLSVWQLEMPRREDIRRFRRLTIGAGDDPSMLQRAASSGSLALYSRPMLDFSDASDVRAFHASVRATAPDLVILDSISAAFPCEDLNDNPSVRRAISRVFLPLAASGIAVVVLHHYRKPQQGAKDDPKGRILGAQQFGAASGMVYGVERMDSKDSGSNFKVILSRLGSWTPGEQQDYVIAVEDTESDSGTTVTVLDERAQLAGGGLTRVQQAALNIKNRVQRNGSVLQSDALTGACGDLGIGKRTAEAGLAYARVRSWIETDKAPGGATKGMVLTPGSGISDPL